MAITEVLVPQLSESISEATLLNWKKQPGAMLVARATSEACRLVAADAILGIGYSSEEIADGGSYDEQVAETTTTPATSTGTLRTVAAKRRTRAS